MTGKARTKELALVLQHIRNRKGMPIKLGWVKSHIGVAGNELADQQAKKAFVEETRSETMGHRGRAEAMG